MGKLLGQKSQGAETQRRRNRWSESVSDTGNSNSKGPESGRGLLLQGIDTRERALVSERKWSVRQG